MKHDYMEESAFAFHAEVLSPSLEIAKAGCTELSGNPCCISARHQQLAERMCNMFAQINPPAYSPTGLLAGPAWN